MTDKKMNATDRATIADKQFADEVFPAEKAAIEARRKKPRGSKAKEDYVGLALSGGGIRSASFSLGVIQALDTRQCIDRIDYLSSVSGGGYAGCSLTACMNQNGGTVPFNDPHGGYGDTDAVQHIRDFSNYLMPRGLTDLVTSFGLIARGWAANIILFAPFFVFSVLWLLWAYPTLDSLKDYGPMQRAVVKTALNYQIWFMPGFPDTTLLIAVAVFLLVIWALARSIGNIRSAGRDVGTASIASTEFHGGFVKGWKFVLGLTVLVAWLELQPLVLRIVSDWPATPENGMTALPARTWLETGVGVWFTKLTPFLAPVSAFIAFMSRNLSRVTSTRKGSKASIFAKRLLAKMTLWSAAIIMPSAIWYLYLLLTLRLMPATLAEFHYLLLSILGFAILAFFIDPNATSLHRLYRDRLSKAFLFDADPGKRVNGQDLAEIAPKLHEIKTETCPYPIVNAALNLEGSAFANRRGRNADFFEFTPLFTGSQATRWVDSKTMSTHEPKLDLGTAMAISGAAFSPNMGSATIKLLVPTLALLNLRLGFWLRNPSTVKTPWNLLTWFIERRCFLLFKEFFSRIDETSPTVYVTDGGNIENLGVHALLKRRCRLIIAIDAEADPSMTFGAYLKLQRYARIDFGALIDLPWQPIRDEALALDARIAAAEETPAPTRSGHHVAVGTIRYGNNYPDGLLVYVKASLTGDENDYILDYKTRNTDFPHETTGDQFFGEEQLEVYRALGFHIMRSFLDEHAPFEVTPEPGETVGDARTRVMATIRGLLDLRDPASGSHHAPQVPIDDGPRDDAGQERDGHADDDDRAIALHAKPEGAE